LRNPSALTPANALGPETAAEHDINSFDDFDDFNGQTFEREAGATGRKYKTSFSVYYVSPSDVNQRSTTQTFVKRMDLKIWRSFPLLTRSSSLDTLKTSFVLGYFSFN
jgi:hypothetical protein